MCLKSDHATLPVSLAPQGSSISSVVTVTPSELKANPSAYWIVDVREKDEAAAPSTKKVPGSVNIPLGSLIHQAADGKLDATKSILCVCNVGFRAGVAAQTLSSLGLKACSLLGGAEAYHGPIASWFNPEYVVVLQSVNEEVATLALSVATASQTNGKQTALVCMGPSPLLFRKEGVEGDIKAPRVSTLNVGDPFKKGEMLIQKYKAAGGAVFACKSCVKFHKLEYEMLEASVDPMQAPDLVRMTTSAQGSTSFS